MTLCGAGPVSGWRRPRCTAAEKGRKGQVEPQCKAGFRAIKQRLCSLLAYHGNAEHELRLTSSLLSSPLLSPHPFSSLSAPLLSSPLPLDALRSSLLLDLTRGIMPTHGHARTAAPPQTRGRTSPASPSIVPWSAPFLYTVRLPSRPGLLRLLRPQHVLAVLAGPNAAAVHYTGGESAIELEARSEE